MADLLEQRGHRFEVSCATRRLGLCQVVSENSGADSTGARFESVCRALDRFRISFFHRPFQSRESCGSILHERVEQSLDYVFDACLTKV